MNMKLTFGEKIKNLREDADMNQLQLGNALGMTQRKISYIECNRCQPSLEDISLFCNYFKVSADYLLDIPSGYKGNRK